MKRMLMMTRMWLLCCAMVMIHSGCNGGSGDTPALGTVNGTVTLDGTPLADATVVFTPTEGRQSSATTDSDGKFELQYSMDAAGAVVGQHQVSITTAGVTQDENGQEVSTPEKVPARYNEESELTADVVAGSNTFDFKLESGK